MDAITALTVQVQTLSRKIDGLTVIQQPAQVMQYDMYGGWPINQDCQAIRAMAKPTEHIDYLGNVPHPQNNPYSDPYNLGWRYHSNFFWGNLEQN